MTEQDRIAEEIAAASFWEQWQWLKELSRIGSPKRVKQAEEAEKARKHWNQLTLQNKANEEVLLIALSSDDNI